MDESRTNDGVKKEPNDAKNEPIEKPSEEQIHSDNAHSTQGTSQLVSPSQPRNRVDSNVVVRSRRNVVFKSSILGKRRKKPNEEESKTKEDEKDPKKRWRKQVDLDDDDKDDFNDSDESETSRAEKEKVLFSKEWLMSCKKKEFSRRREKLARSSRKETRVSHRLASRRLESHTSNLHITGRDLPHEEPHVITIDDSDEDPSSSESSESPSSQHLAVSDRLPSRKVATHILKKLEYSYSRKKPPVITIDTSDEEEDFDMSSKGMNPFEKSKKITDKEMELLRKKQQIPPSIINFGLAHILENKIPEDIRQQVFIFQVNFNLQIPRYLSNDMNFIDKNYLIFPICNQGDWHLIIVSNPGAAVERETTMERRWYEEPTEKTGLFFLAPVKHSFPDFHVKNLIYFLNAVFNSKRELSPTVVQQIWDFEKRKLSIKVPKNLPIAKHENDTGALIIQFFEEFFTGGIDAEEKTDEIFDWKEHFPLSGIRAETARERLFNQCLETCSNSYQRRFMLEKDMKNDLERKKRGTSVDILMGSGRETLETVPEKHKTMEIFYSTQQEVRSIVAESYIIQICRKS